MIIKRLICGAGLFLTLQSCPSFAAGSSSVYQYYLNEGIKAFESHHDEEASRYFAWAREIDPSAKEPVAYAKALSTRQRLEAAAGEGASVYFPYFQEMMEKGEAALQRQDFTAAKEYFYTAHLLDRNAAKPLEYLNLIKRLGDGRVVVETAGSAPAPAPVPAQQPAPVAVPMPAAEAKPRPAAPRVVTAALDRFEKEAAAPAPLARTAAPRKEKKLTEVFSIEEILQRAEGGRALVRVEMGSSIIVEGKNIQKFLVVTEGPVAVKIITADQVQIDAQRIGVTFIHIWDDAGRRTIYVQVVFPTPPEGELVPVAVDTDHAAPFRVNYSNDWNTYYAGPDVPGMSRRSVNFQQSLGVEGQTPYGYFDASGSTAGWHQMLKLLTYTTGLSGIPMPGLTDFNIRFFDAVRHMTPLTFPGSSLRGAYADMNIFNDLLRLSYSHGREIGTFGYFAQGTNVPGSSYIDAARILLFPKSLDKHYSLNYARGYGGGRESYLTEQVYSIEGRQEFGRLSLDGELAQDDRTNAGIAGIRWDDGTFHTALNMRSTGEDFTTVTGSGTNQGVAGATWTVDSKVREASISTALDVYQNHIFYNPDDPDAINYSISAQAGVPLNDDYSIESNAAYSETPGDLSPRTYSYAGARLKRSFDTWASRRGNAYVGGSYQRSRFAFVPTAEYDRYGAVTGVYVPLTGNLSFNGNYEYSWLEEPFSGEEYNPNVLTTGLSYYRQVTDRLTANLGVNYRQEAGFGGTNSFLSGEDSIGYSAGLSYNPARDVTLFLDGRLNSVWGKTENNVSYNDMDLRMGLRSSWGSPFYWDPEGTIEGVVFKDRNSNGKFDKDEEGIPDVKVKVGDKETVTDAAGWYHRAVKRQRAMVSVVADSVPSGYIFSTPAFTKVLVRQGLRDRVDFGLTTRSGIYGAIFVDKNGNGTPDEGDEFVHSVRMVLDGKTAQMSEPQGAYFFTNISPGKHVVTLDMKTLPLKYLPLVKLQNEVNVAEGTTYILHIPLKLKE